MYDSNLKSVLFAARLMYNLNILIYIYVSSKMTEKYCLYILLWDLSCRLVKMLQIWINVIQKLPKTSFTVCRLVGWFSVSKSHAGTRKGVIIIHFLEKSRTVNRASYYQLPRQYSPYLLNKPPHYIYIYIYIYRRLHIYFLSRVGQSVGLSNPFVSVSTN